MGTANWEIEREIFKKKETKLTRSWDTYDDRHST